MKQMTDTSIDLGKILAGAAAGAVLMYMLDPERGRARRAMSTEKIAGMGRQTGSALGNAWHGIGSRVSSRLGQVAEDASRTVSQLASAVKPDGAAGGPLGDTVTRMTQAAGAAMAGPVAGPVAGRLMQAFRGGGGLALGRRNSAMLGGGMLGLYGLLRRSPLGMVIGLAGLALLARSAANKPLASMLRGEALGQTIDLEKSIHIDASPEEVFDLWTNYENFPRFMSHVVEVRDLGRGRSHWVVTGPAGSRFEWDAVVTEKTRPYRLAWRSEPGAEIPNSGSVQFEPERGGTRVTVRLSYTPPAGKLGHGIAVLLGADPKRQMDDDLARMKAFIERGAVPDDAARRGKTASRFLH